MTHDTPFIPFRADAIRRAIGELAATAAPYVRLGALRLMAQMLRDERPRPSSIFSNRSPEEVDRALDQVEEIIREIRSTGSTEDDEQADPEPEPL